MTPNVEPSPAHLGTRRTLLGVGASLSAAAIAASGHAAPSCRAQS